MTDIRGGYFTNTISSDLYELVVGETLGQGIARNVFVYKPDPSCVIKFEAEGCSFQNVYEWQVWDRIKDVKSLSKWFAPCLSISICGSILIQKRARPAVAKELPERIPAFFTDTKVGNWGYLEGKPVATDYGVHLMLENGMTKRMQKAEWRS